MDSPYQDFFAPDSSAPGAAGERMAVLLPLPFPRAFDYLPPPGARPRPGDVVAVPLGRREVVGVVWDTPPDAAVPAGKLRAMHGVIETPGLPEASRRFVDWVAAYTLAPPGEVLAMALRVMPPERLAEGFVATGAAGRVTAARTRALAALADGPLGRGALAEAGVSAAVLRAMERDGLVGRVAMPRDAAAGPDPDFARPELSAPQRAAADALLAGEGFRVTLLDGVTGSGKTEVYLEAVAACLRAGRQALILLPEIALSSQAIERVTARFGHALAWHSELASRERRATYRAVASGAPCVVVGARSALFLPFADLGCVVVDEEHETAFKQEDGVIYHARDMAVVRGRISGAPVILASATPSLESVFNADSGRYARVSLPDRFGGARLPEVRAVDLRVDAPERGRFLSPVLRAAMAGTFARGEQVLLFLNRRGYAPLTLCRACGHRMACPNCTAWLVEHRARRVLTCHHCGHAEGVPEACPACGNAHSLAAVGPGIERISEEVAAVFPEARALVMASDTMPGPHAAAEAARRIVDREVDVIIGTQLVAKGWHFPHLTLVGVVDADLGLAGGDLRAGERTFQVLHQVGGRAGRAGAPGTVLLQTYDPDNPVIQALVSGEAARFWAEEAAQRRPGGWPPYGRLAAVIVSADDGAAADALAAALARAAPAVDGLVVLGPAPAPLSVLRGRHRRRFLVRARRDFGVQAVLRGWIGGVVVPRGGRVVVDVDPVSFL